MCQAMIQAVRRARATRNATLIESSKHRLATLGM